ncbi:MAG: DUF4339 domain-containing protein [Muribaculaceae bacterium]|nr:DUF4339 domain-containing protein [Muribaculaceae bacterium]
MNNNFDSIDRLMELGFSMAIAQQMMQTMNTCMANTTIPHVQVATPAMPAPEKKEYYAVINDAVSGPYSDDELLTLARANTLCSDTMVWAPGMSGWCLARTIPQVNKYIVLSGNTL